MTTPTTAAEAQLEIDRLKAEKKALAASKKDLGAQKTEENSRWRAKEAARVPGYRTGADHLVGTAVHLSRRSQRMQHVETINRLTAEQAAVDEKVAAIDAQLDELAIALKELKAAEKAAAKQGAPKPAQAVAAEVADTAAGPAPSTPATEAAARLASITQLHDDGLLTDEEYEAKRTEIVGSL